jgi:hypothetical protein
MGRTLVILSVYRILSACSLHLYLTASLEGDFFKKKLTEFSFILGLNLGCLGLNLGLSLGLNLGLNLGCLDLN